MRYVTAEDTKVNARLFYVGIDDDGLACFTLFKGGNILIRVTILEAKAIVNSDITIFDKRC